MNRFIPAFLLLNCGLFADTTWQGTTNSMNTPTNWSSGIPTSGENLIFPTSTVYSKSVLNNIGALTIGNLTISDVYTLTGSNFTVGASQSLTYGASGSNINLGSVTLSSGATWTISSNASGNTITSAIGGAGSLNLSGGTLILKGLNTYTGTTTLGTGATLQASSTSAFGSQSNVTIGSGSFLDLNNFNNTIGTLSGSTGSSVTLGTATLTVTNSGTNTFGGNFTGTNGGVALGSGSTGMLTLTGNNTYSSLAAPGTTTVNAGTLQAGSPTAFGSNSNLTVASGATLDLNSFSNTFGTLTGAGTITLGNGNLTISQGGTFSGGITGNGGLTVTSGTLSLTGSGTNTYTGSTIIQGGSTLSLNDLGSTSGLTFSSGGGTLQTLMALSTSIPITLSDVGAINTDGNNVTLSGAISGAGSFTKTGAGTLILASSNNYTGATNINAGTLQLGTTGALGTSSNVTIASGATLDLNSENTSIGSLAGNVGSFITLGSGTLTVANGGTDPFYGIISGSSGVLILSGGTLSLMGENTYTGPTTIENGSTLNTIDLGMTTGLTFDMGGGNLELGSNTTSSVPLTLNGPATIGTNTFNVTITGSISGTGSLNKLGLGTLTLTGQNTSSGQLTIEGGVLNVTPSSLGIDTSSATAIVFDTFGGTLQAGADFSGYPISIPITLSTSGTIDTNGNNMGISGDISGGGNLTKIGAGLLTLTGNNAYSGLTTIQNGTLNASSSAFPTASKQLVFSGTSGMGIFQASNTFTSFPGSIVFMSSGTIDTNGFSITVPEVVAGSLTSTFTKSGTGTLTLSGLNIYTGPTSITAGTLQAGVATTSAGGAFGIGSAVSISNGATLDLNNFNNTIGSLSGATGSSVTLGSATLTITNGNSLTFAGNISDMGGGGLTLSSGALTLSGSNTYTGATTVNGGTLSAGSTAAFGSLSHVTIASGGTLGLGTFNNTIGSLSGVAGSFVTLGSGTLTVNNGNSQTFAGIISGSGGFTLTTGVETLSGLNTYTGATTINGGTLTAGVATVSSNGAFGNNSAVTIASGGTLNLNNFNNTVGSLTGSAGSAVTLGSATLTINNGNSQTFSGLISGTGGLTLTTGNFTLDGSNTYTGATTVNGGTLLAGVATTSGNGAFGNASNVTVASGATVDFQTFDNTVGSLTNSGTVLSSATVTATTFTQNSAATLTLDVPTNAITPFGNISTSGAITMSGALTVTNSGSFTPTAGQELILLQSLGTGKQLHGKFSSTTSAFSPSSFSYDYSENKVILGFSGMSSCSSTWSATTSGTWGDTMSAPNWNPACAPGVDSEANTETATLGDVSASAIAITLADSSNSMVQSITLHDLNFDSTTTSYTIQQFNGMGTITLDSVMGASLPKITVLSGTHTIDAPIVMSQDSRFSLHSGSLTLGSNSGVTSMSNQWNLSEGSGPGTLINYAAITPADVLIEGNVVENYGTINPTATLSISGLEGIDGIATVNNHHLMSSGTQFSIGGVGPTTVSNNDTMASGDTFTISSTGVTTVTNAGTLSSTTDFVINGVDSTSISNTGSMTAGSTFTISNSGNASIANSGTMSSTTSFTIGGAGSTPIDNTGIIRSAGNFTINGLNINNTSGGTIFSTGGNTLSVTGGNVTNDASSTLGASTENLTFSEGTISTSGPVLALDYTQSGSANLQVDVASISSFGSVTADGTATLGGKITVDASPNLSLTSGQTVNLVTAVNGLNSTTFSTTSFKNFPSSIIPNLVYTPNAVQLDVRDTIPSHSGGTTQITFTSVNQHNFFIARKCFQLRDRFDNEEETKEQEPKQSYAARFSKENLYASNDSLAGGFLLQNLYRKTPKSPILAQQPNPEIEEKQEQLTEKVADSPRIIEKPGSVYAGPIASFGNIKEKGDQRGFGYNSVGALLGFDYALPNEEKKRPWDFGLGAIVDYRRITGEDLLKTDAIHGSLYSTIVPTSLPELAFALIGGFAYDWVTLSRKAGIDNQETAIGNPRETLYDIFFDVEYMFSHRLFLSIPKGLRIIPLASIQYIHANVSSYTEQGAGLYDLKVDGQNFKSLTSVLGTRINHIATGSKFTFRTELDAGWQREYLDHNQIVGYTAFNATTEGTTVTTFGAGRNSLLLALDLLATIRNTVQIEANCSYKLNSLFYDVSFYLGVGTNF